MTVLHGYNGIGGLLHGLDKALVDHDVGFVEPCKFYHLSSTIHDFYVGIYTPHSRNAVLFAAVRNIYPFLKRIYIHMTRCRSGLPQIPAADRNACIGVGYYLFILTSSSSIESEVVIILAFAWKPLWVTIISENSLARFTLDISSFDS